MRLLSHFPSFIYQEPKSWQPHCYLLHLSDWQEKQSVNVTVSCSTSLTMEVKLYKNVKGQGSSWLTVLQKLLLVSSILHVQSASLGFSDNTATPRHDGISCLRAIFVLLSLFSLSAQCHTDTNHAYMHNSICAAIDISDFWKYRALFPIKTLLLLIYLGMRWVNCPFNAIVIAPVRCLPN